MILAGFVGPWQIALILIAILFFLGSCTVIGILIYMFVKKNSNEKITTLRAFR